MNPREEQKGQDPCVEAEFSPPPVLEMGEDGRLRYPKQAPIYQSYADEVGPTHPDWGREHG